MAGDILYQADWSTGYDGWAGDESWKYLDEMLLNDGLKERSSIRAPFKPGELGIRNYAVEVEIQAIKDFCGTFGIIARSGYWGGIEYTACYGDNSAAVIAPDYPSFGFVKTLSTMNYYPGTDWHKYRLEVEGNKIRLFIDDRLMAEAQANAFLDGGEISSWSSEVPLNVRNFKVTAL